MKKMKHHRHAVVWAVAVWIACLLPAGWAVAGNEYPTDKAPTIYLGARYDNIGFVVVTGDFNGDGHTDLFFSAPGD